jgi:ribonucleoside-diphosphate reductase alpha chain
MNSLSQYQTYIHQSRYARWNDKKKRRETWEETVDRYVEFFSDKIPEQAEGLSREEIREELRNNITTMNVMPSMRSLMTAGKALEKAHIGGYNCSYTAIDDPRVFSEIMYINMHGTGVGFSCERQYVNKLPVISEEFFPTDIVIKVKDSRLGWCVAFQELISLLYAGRIPSWDTTEVRPAGSILKTFGGRASGPEPLDKLFHYCVALFQKAAGRKLNSLECHDLVCNISACTVAGGVRRAALISLSNLSDDRMRSAKTGQWYVEKPNRSFANNSAVYTERPTMDIFLKEFTSLIESRSGERGIFNRVAAVKKAKKYGRRDPDQEFGTNPCGEILLASGDGGGEFCNLSSVILRSEDTKESILKKIRIATIIGTLQSTLTDFKYLRKSWKKKCEEERLLGVSLNGICDNKFMSTPSKELSDFLEVARQYAVEINKVYAEALGINPAAAITCVKPEGNSSQLVGSASGIHDRWAPKYIRRVRGDKKDPLTQLLIDSGIPHEVDKVSPNTVVFSFPIKSPDGAVFKGSKSAVDQLELYAIYNNFWAEHNPSITIYVKDEEWLEVGAWVYRNFDNVNGISFLPASDHVYEQAPYEEINDAMYEKLASELPVIDFSKLFIYEAEDHTEPARELACSSGTCELS